MCVVRGDTFQQEVTISIQQVRGWLLEKHEPLKGKLKQNNVKQFWGFPGGAVVKNLPANAGDVGSSPGPGRSHMPRCN